MKKETLKDAKHNCEGCQGKGYLDETDGHDYGKVVCPVCVNDKEPKQDHFQEMNDFMIKETLEEAADKYFPSAEKIGGETYTAYKGFIEGAKWQAELFMYSEEDMKQFGLYLVDNLKQLKSKTIDEILEQFKNC